MNSQYYFFLSFFNNLFELCYSYSHFSYSLDHLSGVMGRVQTSSAVDYGSGQTKQYKIGICCFSTRHAALKSKGKYQLAWDQDNVSEGSNYKKKYQTEKYPGNVAPFISQENLKSHGSMVYIIPVLFSLNYLSFPLMYLNKIDTYCCEQ